MDFHPMRCLLVPFALMTAAISFGGQQSQNPFKPPAAKIHFAPDRTFDLKKVYVEITVDYPGRKIAGMTRNTLAPLQDGTKQIVLHAGESLRISKLEVNGKTASYKRDGSNLLVQVPTVPKGTDLTVTAEYSAVYSRNSGGFHFIQPNKSEPYRVGFWTQGETEGNRDWAVTWDYPNDFALTETRTTVPAEWTVIGNGIKTEDKVQGRTRTVGWRMDQPHATYLLSLVAAPMDVATDRYRGKPLIYAVPRGKGGMIEASFGDTKQMLEFFESITGVPYPWPKYAQNAMYEFGGGMENVSSTTLGEGSLTDGRDGFRTMASLNSHELAHQWFGDLVTCKDWGQIWLNESFATLFETLYTEHLFGKSAYDREIDSNMRAYFFEARRYTHPLATNLYRDPDSMFDSHTYPKGGVVLHSLRRFLGDQAFFAGLKLYLERNRHQPVETSQLVAALTDASGVNVQPFFDQWVLKPGHPLLESSWSYDEAKRAVVLKVSQKQDTSAGIPIYDIDAKVGVIRDGQLERIPVRLSQAEQTIELPMAAKPSAVLLDPDHDFLREIRGSAFRPEEAEAVFLYAPNPTDRDSALSTWMASKPSDEAIQRVVSTLRSDNDRFPVFLNLGPLVRLKREDLRSFYLAELEHKNFERRAQAVEGLRDLQVQEATTQVVRNLIQPDAPYDVLREAVRALAVWDAKGNVESFQQAVRYSGESDSVLVAAYAALAASGQPASIEQILRDAGPEHREAQRVAALRALVNYDGQRARVVGLLHEAINNGGWRLVSVARDIVDKQKLTELVGDLKAYLEKDPPDFLKTQIEATIGRLEPK
jgi:aminopeptidase N